MKKTITCFMVRRYAWSGQKFWKVSPKYVNSDIAPFGSREIARDFLSFVEEYDPKLTPYRTFELCGERHEASTKADEPSSG